MTKPLNLNLRGKVLPSHADDRLVRTLFLGDSQMEQNTERIMGQIIKWDIPFVGRHCGLENQPSVGVNFTAVTGSAYGATLTNSRVEVGEAWTDGDTANHFYHGRQLNVDGAISPNFSELAVSSINATGFTQAYDRDVRHYGKIAVYDMTNQASGFGFNKYRFSERRGSTDGSSTDITLAATGGIVVSGREIRAAGFLGSAGNDIGFAIKDSNANDSGRSLHVLGTLFYQSESGSDFPASGFIPFQINQGSYSAYDLINRVSVGAFDAAIEMAEGFETCVIMLGHNQEDDAGSDVAATYVANLALLKARVADRHAALGYAVPDFVFIAPWAIQNEGQTARLRAQTDALYNFCRSSGDGFINLFDYFGGQLPDGTISTPRGSSDTYTLDADPDPEQNDNGTHPADTDTAIAFAKDIEWNFNPANFQRANTTNARRLRRRRRG